MRLKIDPSISRILESRILESGYIQVARCMSTRRNSNTLSTTMSKRPSTTSYREMEAQRFFMMAKAMMEYEQSKIENARRMHDAFEADKAKMDGILLQCVIAIDKQREDHPEWFLEATGQAMYHRVLNVDGDTEVVPVNPAGIFDDCRLSWFSKEENEAEISVNDSHYLPFHLRIRLDLEKNTAVATGRIERHEEIPRWQRQNSHFSIPNVAGKIANAEVVEEDDNYVISVSDPEFPLFSLRVVLPKSRLVE